MGRIFQLSKIDAAVNQLDWAIRLLVDHQAYVAAITLAGAAEEILGGAINQDDNAHRTLRSKFEQATGLSGKTISDQYLNKARNWLKHWDRKSGSEKIELELELDAIQHIARALYNLFKYDRSLPSEGLRFREWVKANHSELLSD